MAPRTPAQRLRKLLSSGFFPAQVPSCFTSTSFARYVQIASKEWKKIHATRCKEESAYEKYSVARVGHNRRPICITNPVAQYFLAECISSNWRVIKRLFAKSKISLSVPKFGDDMSRAITITPMKELNERRLLFSVGARYQLATDVAQFFPSIYSHAIAWAVEGKDAAKKKVNRHNKALLGPLLDELCRYTQANQTIGIPIGPDTSHIVAEVVSSAIDVEIYKALGKWPRGFRHVDDYSLYFETENEALGALTAISNALSKYELKINIQKTKITPIADTDNDSWTYHFDLFQFSSDRQTQRRDLHRYFDMALSLAKSNEDENVMQYALRRVETELIKSSNWDVFVAYLLRCMDAYANTIPECALIISTYKSYLPGLVKNDRHWEEFLASRIIQHAPLEHHSEVAWLLWLALRLEIRIGSNAVSKIEKMNSSVCLLLALALESKKLLRRKVSRKVMPDCTNASILYSEHWLLAYEGAVKGWLPESVPVIQSDQYFSELSKLRIEFIDLSMTPLPIFTLKATPRLIDDLFASDDNIDEYFDFREADEDYLGRRSSSGSDDDMDFDDLLPL